MTTFSDPEHALRDVVFQGANEQPVFAVCNTTVLHKLEQWTSRSNLADPLAKHFQLDDTRSFTISYQGECANFWPDENMNILGQTLIREFLFSDGICTLDDMSPKLYVVKYRVQAMDDVEYLLVCPYPTTSNNISGLLVVCVNNHVDQIDERESTNGSALAAGQ